MTEWIAPRGYEDDYDDFYDEDDGEAYASGYEQAYSDAFQDGYASGSDRLASEQQFEAFEAAQDEAEIEALEAERERVERTETGLGRELAEAEEALGWRLAPETIDYVVSHRLVNEDQHILDTIKRLIPPPDWSDPLHRRVQLAADMEITQQEREVDREEDAAAIPEELEPHLDEEEREPIREWNAEAARMRREFESLRRPLTDAEADSLAGRTFGARMQGDSNFSFLDADNEAGPLDMRNPADRRLTTAEIILEEQRKSGEDTTEAEANLRWHHGEGHGGDE